MWHPDLKRWGAWLIAVMSFIVASLCFSQLLKSLNRNEDFYGKLFGRTGAFLLGFLGLIFFWLCISLPTNTHTLIYGSKIKSVMTEDLTRTKGYLETLKTNHKGIKDINSQYSSVSAQINSQLESMRKEIDHPGHEGIGYRFNAIIDNIDRVLSTAIGRDIRLTRVERVGSNRAQWLHTYSFYQKAAFGQLQVYRNQCDEKIRQIRHNMNDKELDAKIINISLALKDISDMNGVNHDVINAASNDLAKSYSYIKNNAQHIDFKPEDVVRYTAEPITTDAESLLNVQDVISDYVKTDRYKGCGYWILIAMLVDIAGFIFFYIGFNSKNNNAIA